MKNAKRSLSKDLQYKAGHTHEVEPVEALEAKLFRLVLQVGLEQHKGVDIHLLLLLLLFVFFCLLKISFEMRSRQFGL